MENFFDPQIDSVNADVEFTPTGEKHWTNYRYNQKLLHIYKSLIAVSAWNSPALVGLCEVENKKVLRDLTLRTPLLKLDYDFIHFDSPDHRGIDCALLYSPKRFVPLYKRPVRIINTDQPDFTTRDILYVKGFIPEAKDTLHVFVNHWPSRRNGNKISEFKRMLAAKVLRRMADSILASGVKANILIMGDFNDEPHNSSIKDILQAGTGFEPLLGKRLYNLAEKNNSANGSIKYQGQWYLFDQFIVSGTLIMPGATVHVDTTSFHICSRPFLVTDDEKFMGKKPYGTYAGYNYMGGFSDHLPVRIDLRIIRK